MNSVNDNTKTQDIIEDAKNQAKKQREKQVLLLIREGKTQIEIAGIMGVSAITVSKWISKIDSKKVEQARQEGEKERIKKKNEKILQLLSEGKTQTEIAKIMGVSKSLISKRTKETNYKKVVRQGQGGKYNQLKQKLKECTITRDEIDDYREYLDYKYNKIELREIILMANMYIKTKRTDEAIKFLNLLINNEDMEYLGKEKLIQARDETEKIRKIQRARSLIKNGKSTCEIIRMTGLSEIEIHQIRNQMQDSKEM